ncbi:hypothetical protein Tco_0291247 [Tanacetum coccineum]
MTFVQLEEKFIPVWESIQDFVPMDSKKESESLKRLGILLEKVKAKRLKTMLVREETSVNITSSVVKVPICDWKIYKDKITKVYQIFRVGQAPKLYPYFESMLKDFDRDDLVTLWKLVKDRFKTELPKSDLEKCLFWPLKVMFEPVATDLLWQFEAPIKSWKMYKSCKVHCLSMEGMIIYMLDDVEYPFQKTTLKKMLDHKCETLDDLPFSVPMGGPYQTNPPSPDDIKLLIQIKRQGVVTRIRHEQEIENVFCLGHKWDHVPTCLCHMLFCIATSIKYNLAYFISKRMEFVTKQAQLILPYGMLLTRMFDHIISENPELSSHFYVLYNRVMYLLSTQPKRKTRKDYGTRKGRSSTSSSSAFGQPSSSHPIDDDNDGNDERTSRESTPSPTHLVNSLTNEGPMKDQPLSADASPITLSLGYITDSNPEEDKEDPEEDPADHPANG